MFSRAKRFNYPEPEPKTPSPECHRHNLHHSVVTPRNGPSTSMARPTSLQNCSVMSTPRPGFSTAPQERRLSKLPKDMSLMLNQLEELEKRIQNRCNTIDSLCRDFPDSPVSRGDSGFFSSRSSSPRSEAEELATPALELELIPSPAENLVEICEMIAEMVCKKLDERSKGRSFWKKTKSWVVRANKSVKIMVEDLVCPRVIHASIKG